MSKLINSLITGMSILVLCTVFLVNTTEASTRFSVTPTSGSEPLTVTFTAEAFANSWTDSNTGNIVQIVDRGDRYISFGDGSNDVKLTCVNPTASTCQVQISHIYSSKGTFNASLFTAGYYGIKNDDKYGTKSIVESLSIVVGGNVLTGQYTSCVDAKEKGNNNSGQYNIIGLGSVYCDMATNGGGWTGITPEIAHRNLGGTLTILEGNGTVNSGFSSDRPYTQDGAGGHTAYYTFKLPFMVKEFYLKDYVIMSNAGPNDASDIDPNKFTQTSWSDANGSSVGDVSFGFANDSGPVASFARELNGETLRSFKETVAWPSSNKVFTGAGSKDFRIGWGDEGLPSEGWYPWWSGLIMVRERRPSTTVIGTVKIMSPTGGVTITSTNPLIEGSGVPNNTVVVKSVHKLCNAVVNSIGRWSCTLQGLAPGSYNIVAYQYTQAGAPNGVSTAGFVIKQANNTGLCTQEITSYMKIGQYNDPAQVKKLQEYLNSREGERLAVTGVFDFTTEAAVKRYQQKYARDILYPWGMYQPSGYVYKTTINHINRQLCSGQIQCPVFTQYYKRGQYGGEIGKIQSFLKSYGYYSGPITGYFDWATDAGIKAFQEEFRPMVLTPWNLAAPTGNWYKTSRKQANWLQGCYEQVTLEGVGLTF